MSDIPRFSIIDGQEYPDLEGQWVFVNDALAAVAAARAEGKATLNRAENAWREEIRLRLTEQYEAGVKAARDAVAGVPGLTRVGMIARDHALAVIDALRGGS